MPAYTSLCEYIYGSMCQVHILLNANPRKDDKGEVYGVVGVGQDITERKQAEEELQSIAADLKRLIDTANAPIFGIDKNGLIKEWNQKAAEITGYSHEAAMGKSLVETYINPSYRDSVAEVLSKALHGESTSNFEFPLLLFNIIYIIIR